MELSRAKQLAVELMDKHKLLDLGWHFMFDNAKRRLGCCKYRYKLITLSKPIVLVNDERIIINTILHEIAHALVGAGHGHDEVWRRKAIEIGCNGNRCCSDNVNVEGKYVAVCDGCNTRHYIHRAKKRNVSCGKCSGGRYNEKFKLIFRLNLEIKK